MRETHRKVPGRQNRCNCRNYSGLAVPDIKNAQKKQGIK